MKKIILILLVLTGIIIVLIASGRKEEKMAPAMDGASYAPILGVLPPNTDVYVKPSDANLKKMLNKIQYSVTQEDGTERAFNNVYWDYKEDGIYVDIVSGEPLFSSTDKYDSQTGWPSFTKPLEEGNIILNRDTSLSMVRVEVRSLYADSHLGHLFKDGPLPTKNRYCINSASLRFIPVNKLLEEGYEDYLYLFEDGGIK